MKKIFYLLLLGLLAGAARPGQAQQMAQYSQYMNNNYLLNPAVAGTEDYIDVKLSYRAQWTGVQGAPRTYYLSANSALGALHSQKKRTLHDWQKSFHALGGIVYNDVTGPTSRLGIYASYTYNVALTRRLRLALGASFGMQQFSIDGSQLGYYNVNTVGVSEAYHVPDATVGLWLYSPDFYAGVSSAQVFGNQLDASLSAGSQGVYRNKLERHYFATAGVRLPLGEDVSVVPSVLVKYMSPAPASVDLNAKIKFQDALWVGGSWRVGNAFVGMVGVNFSTLGSLSYSYDTGIAGQEGSQWNSHEVLLTLKLKRKPHVVCADRFWH